MKRAIIVGASRGIGLALVREQLKKGWHVTATVRSAAPELEALVRDHDGRCVIERVDITDGPQVKALAGRLQGQQFDLLFLNAGIMRGRGLSVSDIPQSEIDEIFLTNAVSPIRVADALVGMVAGGGMVAFMSSILGSISTNDDGRAELYRASKAALNSLIRSFAARHGDRGLTILALHPGVVRTAMGGPTAPLDIETSVTGLSATIDQRWGKRGTAFVDYRNEVIAW
ncbi:MAG: SDR family oxidoreductase [Hyphomicrobiaceae bacterium]